MQLPLFPEKWLQRMEQQLGSEYPAFINALSEAPVVSLRMNPRKPCPPFEGAVPVPWCPGGFYLPERPRFIRDPFIQAGSYYVQEASSMFLAQLIDFTKDQVILDLCAAPGGKSTLIASRMTEGSVLVSNELVGDRAAVLEENISRWGHPNCIVTQGHPKDFAGLRNLFDTLVVDAPCSGEGMFRKDPDSIAHWSPGMVQQCAMRQKDILRFVVPALKPGGRLIYSTCTYNADENEEIVQWLLHHDPGMFVLKEIHFPENWGLRSGITQGYADEMRWTQHCFPHRVRGEGLYFAVLEKVRAGTDAPSHPRRDQKKKFFRDKQEKRGVEEGREKFPKSLPKPSEMIRIASAMIQPGDWKFTVKEDNVSAAPSVMHDLPETLSAILRVRKAGITLGKFSGNKFIPDHDLAMSELQATHVPAVELEYEDALRYLKRMEPEKQVSGNSEWAVVQYKGRNLGWAKLLGNRMNNHLPQHLRIRADILD